MSMRYLSWTDFNQPGRVHVLSWHNTEQAGANSVKRFRSIYPNLKLIEAPDLNKKYNGDVCDPTDQASIQNAQVLA